MRKRPMLLFACVFLTGLAYQRYKNLWLMSGIIILIAMEVYCGMQQRKVKRIVGRSLVLLSAFFLGVLHMQKEETFRNRYLSKIEDSSNAVVWGEIKKIEQTEYSFRLILSDCYISLKDEVMPCNDVMVYTSSDHFHVGEIHKITGKVNRFSKACNEGNFDSRIYYESQKIDLSMQEESSKLLDKNTCWLREWILGLKVRLQNVYTECMEKDAAGFYTAMVTGDRDGLEDEIKNLFQIGGISHILAISGLHVSILGRNIYNWLRKCRAGFLISGICAGTLLLCYCYMVGYGMSAVRAVGMMLLFFLAQHIGRSYDMQNALGAVCMLLLWENAFLIEYSGFWLSVMALFGAGIAGRKDGNKKQKRRLVDIQGGVWISMATLPVIALCYYEIPLYATLVNAVVLPLLPFVFGMAVVGGLIGLYVPGIAEVIFLPCEWGLNFYEWICMKVAQLPFASIITGKPAEWQVVLYYLVLLVGVSLSRCKSRSCVKDELEDGKGSESVRMRGLLPMVVLIVICSGILFIPKDKGFEITFLDVGQGDGIYINIGDGTAYFIDGGSSNVSEVGNYRILPFLKSKGVRSIDYWFVSHVDTDHTSGLVEVLESGYRIKHLVFARGCPKDENYEALKELAVKHDVDILYMDAGERIITDDTTMMCLYPNEITEDEKDTEQNYMGDRNELSMVLLFEWEDTENKESISVLFSGDCSSETEEIWTQELASVIGQSDSDIRLFKAAHHGSNYSNGDTLLETFGPDYVVVSCSATNHYGHPGKDAVARLEMSGADIFYTMASGQIKIRWNKGRIELEAFKE